MLYADYGNHEGHINALRTAEAGICQKGSCGIAPTLSTGRIGLRDSVIFKVIIGGRQHDAGVDLKQALCRGLDFLDKTKFHRAYPCLRSANLQQSRARGCGGVRLSMVRLDELTGFVGGLA